MQISPTMQQWLRDERCHRHPTNLTVLALAHLFVLALALGHCKTRPWTAPA